MKRHLIWILFLIGFTVAWFRPGHADPLTPQDAVAYAKQTNRLPEWFNFSSHIRFQFDLRSMRIFSCIENAAGQRWTGWIGIDGYGEILHTGRWTPRQPVPTTAADERICWPPSGPVANGEPAYLNLVCPDGCSDGKPLDYTQMNRATNIAGATAKGEPCGEDAGMGFYTIPRLQKAGTSIVPVTRCEVLP